MTRSRFAGSIPLTITDALGMTAPLGSLTTSRSVPDWRGAWACDGTTAKPRQSTAAAAGAADFRILIMVCSLAGRRGETLRVDLRVHLDSGDRPLFAGDAAGGAPDLERELDAVGVAPVLEEQREINEDRRLAGHVADLLLEVALGFPEIVLGHSARGARLHVRIARRLRHRPRRTAGHDSRLRPLVSDHQRQVGLFVDEQPCREVVGALDVDHVGL